LYDKRNLNLNKPRKSKRLFAWIETVAALGHKGQITRFYLPKSAKESKQYLSHIILQRVKIKTRANKFKTEKI